MSRKHPPRPGKPGSRRKAESEIDTRPSGEGGSEGLPAGVQFGLSVFEGPDTGARLLLRRSRVVVGEGRADLPLGDPNAGRFAVEVSGLDVRLRVLAGGPVQVNGKPASETSLHDRDEIRIGSTGIVFTASAIAAVAAAAGAETIALGHALQRPPVEAVDPGRAPAAGAETIALGRGLHPSPEEPGGPGRAPGAGAETIALGRALQPAPGSAAMPGPAPAAGTETIAPGQPAAGKAGAGPAAADATVLDGPMRRSAPRPLAAPRQVRLEVLEGPDAGNVYDVSRADVYRIGRRGGEVPLTDVKCSGKHAQVEVLGHGDCYVQDLASTNGTFLNDARVQRARLVDGDVIRVGRTRLRFTCRDVEPGATG